MGGDLLTMDNPRITALFQQIDRALEQMEHTAKNCKPILNGECYLTDKEVSQRLKVSRQTLQEYRDAGKIAFCQLGGKILYRSGDIENALNQNYRQARRAY